MLRLSTKGRYGTRLMVDLARHGKKSSVFLKDIARRQDISVGYLEHLIPPLKKAKLIRAIRGAHGGYMLTKAPSKITLRHIIEALEGSLSPVKCVDSPSLCKRKRICPTHSVWKLLGEKISHTLEGITLNTLLKQQKI
jgi:Rrf2 family protein